ncbi:hypothetical protein DTO212C5_2203 [Paecilomyces variotii]|nr:hypothetical protein DTO212C5_2203 [Paecilomyces variotii]
MVLPETTRQQITAALFRQEPYPYICLTYNVSDRQLRRIAHCLRTWGTTAPPRKEHTKPMGRPPVVPKEVQEELRDYVEKHPIAGLKEIQSYLQSECNTKFGLSTISRRLKDMGYALSIVSRGATSVEKDNIPNLSQEDRERLLLDPVATEAMAGRGTVYAWLRGTKPVPRRQGVRPKRKRASDDPQGHEVEDDREPCSEFSDVDSPEHDANGPDANIRASEPSTTHGTLE